MITENGWPSCGTDQLDYSTIPGTSVVLPLQIGYPNTVMKAFAADINAYVEPLDGRSDIGGWTATNSVATSNHLGGTAMDLAWNNHPFHMVGTYSSAQQSTIRELLNWYEGNIYWGGDWTDPVDEMHYQMGYNTYNNPAVTDFVNRKISPNHFSTFRRTIDGNLEDFMATNQEKLDLIYNKLGAYPDDPNIGGQWATRARYASEPKQKIDDTVGMMLWTDANGFDLMVEFAASQGYGPARALIAARAKAHPEDAQAVFYAAKYPA